MNMMNTNQKPQEPRDETMQRKLGEIDVYHTKLNFKYKDKTYGEVYKEDAGLYLRCE